MSDPLSLSFGGDQQHQCENIKCVSLEVKFICAWQSSGCYRIYYFNNVIIIVCLYWKEKHKLKPNKTKPKHQFGPWVNWDRGLNVLNIVGLVYQLFVQQLLLKNSKQISNFMSKIFYFINSFRVENNWYILNFITLQTWQLKP